MVAHTDPVERDASGRFQPGNRTSKLGGNPYAKKVAALRHELFQAVTPEDMRAVVLKLVEKALDGDVIAIREVLDRTLGKAEAQDALERIAKMEELLKPLGEG